MNIRLMEEKDLPQVAAIEQLVSKEPWTEKGLSESLQREEAHFIVAEEDDRILGFCGYYQAFDEAEIVEVAVDLSCQGRGIGKQIVNRLMEDAVDAGVTIIILEVRVSNGSAISVYEKAGFENIGIRKRFYSHPVEDAIIMRWEKQ